jgi:molecular chaperone GrpE
MTKKTGKHIEKEEKHKLLNEDQINRNKTGNDIHKSEEKVSGKENQTEIQERCASEDQLAELNQKIQELTDQLEDCKNCQAKADDSAREWQDKYIRLSAEFDNYRKRTMKEKADLIKQANGDLLKDILPVIDDFERGIDHIDKTEDLSGLKQGIILIYNKFAEFIRQNGIKEIEANEKEFDIDFHEALTKIPAPTEELKGKVVDVIEKGYLLNDRVIRYAKVVVGE